MRVRDEFEETVAVAVFDALGFRELVNRTSLPGLRGLVGEVSDAAAGARLVEERTGSMVLSDTIILYGDPANSLELSAAFIVVSASNRLNALARRRTPVRGALTVGELYVDPRRNAMAGKALVRGYELERSQEWHGAIVDPEARDTFRIGIDHSPFPNELVPYPAPLKSGTRTEYECVNWVHRFTGAGQDVEEVFGLAMDTDHAIYRKYRNTPDFTSCCVTHDVA